MEIGCKLCEDDESLDVENKLYISVIGSVLNLTNSRPDIMLAVGLLA